MKDEMVLNRINWIDVMRAIAIFAIVYGHMVLGESLLSQFFGSFRVAAFFVVMGLTYRYKKGFISFIKRRAIRVLVPYYSFAVFSILVFAFFGHFYPALVSGQDTRIIHNVIGALYGNGLKGNMKWNLPLWFLPCSFVVSIIVYFVEKKVSTIRERNKQFARLIFVLVSICLNLVYCRWFRWLKLPFGTEVALSMSGFMELGVIFAIYERKLSIYENTKRDGALGLILIIFCAFLSTYNGEVSVMSLRFGDNTFLYYFIALLSVIGIVLVSKWFCTLFDGYGVQRFICYCGRHTMVILCIHKFIVLVFQNVIPYTKVILVSSYDSLTKNLMGIGITIIVILICLFVEIPINKVCPIVLGNNKKQ